MGELVSFLNGYIWSRGLIYLCLGVQANGIAAGVLNAWGVPTWASAIATVLALGVIIAAASRASPCSPRWWCRSWPWATSSWRWSSWRWTRLAFPRC